MFLFTHSQRCKSVIPFGSIKTTRKDQRTRVACQQHADAKVATDSDSWPTGKTAAFASGAPRKLKSIRTLAQHTPMYRPSD